MRIGIILAALAGLALAVYLIFYAGIGAILTAVEAVGWGGFVLLCFYGAALFAVLGSAWFVLIPPRENPRLVTFIWGRAVRDCAGEVLPFSQVGGILIGARAVMLRQVSGALAFASTMVDVTVEMIAQIAFVLTGLALLLARVPRSPASNALAGSLAIGLLAAGAAAALFLLLQRQSFGLILRWTARFLPEATAGAGAVHRSLADIHASSIRLAVAFAIHLAAWLATALWAWIAIRLIGRRLSFPSVLAIEAILYGIRSAAIVVPGAIGVQEAAYVILGPLFGLPAPAAIALSLLKRARDVALGVPVLLAWQAAEGGHALKASRDATTLFVDE